MKKLSLWQVPTLILPILFCSSALAQTTDVTPSNPNLIAPPTAPTASQPAAPPTPPTASSPVSSSKYDQQTNLFKPAPVHEFNFDNGLKLLVKQDKRAPIVASYVWYKVGSSYEPNGSTGISHVLEHMMFKGTEKYPTGKFNEILAEIGAQNNAFTSDDYTAYYQILASKHLSVAFDVESDRMRGLLLPPLEFKKEIEVVKEERRWRTDDKPTSKTYEQFKATAYLNSPYQTPVIGWMTDLAAMKNDDLKAWYKQWYAPNNATLVVVGDVEPKAVYELAKHYFAAIKPSKITPVKPQKEVPQIGKRHIVVKAPAELPYLLMGYKVPNIAHAKPSWEAYALVVLASILDGGNSARFPKELVRGQEIASSASADYEGYGRMNKLFTVSGIPSKDHTVKNLEEAFLAQIERLKNELVSPQELARIKAQTIAEEVYEQDSVSHQATLIGFLESVGLGYQVMDDYINNIQAVTAEQIQAVAKKYLLEDHLTVAELIPQPIDPNKAKRPRRSFIR
ncbi:MAG TPA: insulinase family protein [Thiothrix sp.]|nr:insulinase family protein [Thiothrix sp.]